MKTSICGANCVICPMNNTCKGCRESDSAPFGKKCMLSQCASLKSLSDCSGCQGICELRDRAMAIINDNKPSFVPSPERLFPLLGMYVNLEYETENGKQKLLDDDKIYLGAQIPCPESSGRCYGIVTDLHNLLICSYGVNGSNPLLILQKNF